MKAWRVHDMGEPKDTFVLEDVAEPKGSDLAGMGLDFGGWVPMSQIEDPELMGGLNDKPYPDWTIIEVTHAALAWPDVTMCRGTYPVTVRRPYTSGQEGVGTVIDASPDRRHLVGRRVAGCMVQPFGSLAPVAVGVGMYFEVPDEMSDEEAAGFVIPTHTAYHAVCRRGQVQSGETVVVLGAAGGVGSCAVQLAAARGAKVIAVVGGREKAEFCRTLGAGAVVDHHERDFVEGVLAANDGRPVDVVIDPVQGEPGQQVYRLLRAEGRRVIVGHAGGLPPIDPNFYYLNHTLVGVGLTNYTAEEFRVIERDTQADLRELLKEGKIVAPVHKCVDFNEVPQAVTEIAERESIGRTVVRVRY